MKTVPILLLASVTMLLSTLAHSAEDAIALRLVICQASWLDWKDKPALAEPFNKHLKANYKVANQDGSVSPVGSMTVLAKKVSRVFPKTMGQGLGFTVLVDAEFAAVRDALAIYIAKPMHQQCSVDEYTKSCTLAVGNKKTILVYSEIGSKSPQTFVGCSYE